jgi:hypothetical protein
MGVGLHPRHRFGIAARVDRGRGVAVVLATGPKWCFLETVTDSQRETDSHPAEETPLYVDAATRVSKPSAFDDWYYGIEDKLGQGTVGMAVCFVMFMAILITAITCSPI